MSVGTEIERAIRGFLATKPKGSAGVIATEFIAQNAVLIEKWAAQKVTRMIEREMRSARPPKSHPFQLFLSGFAPSIRVPLKGHVISLGKATVSKLRESVRLMQAEALANPKIEAFARLADEMSPYAKTHRGVTVEEWCELRAAGVDGVKAAK